MAIPEEDVAQVRAATDIVALIGEQTALKRVGRRFVGLCPFHSEKSASFSVNGEEGLYYCFGCQASGDAISFVRVTEGCDFVEAVERLAARAGITVRNDDSRDASVERGQRQKLYEVVGAAVDFYHDRLLNNPDAGRARQYLRSRGYDGDVVRQFKLGYAPAGYDTLVKSLKLPAKLMRDACGFVFETQRGQQIDAFRERVIFPIFDPGGRPIGIGGRVLPEELRTNTREPGPKYRNSPESSVYSKRRTLYGLNWSKTEISRTNEAIVCEGYTDVIGFFTSGIGRAVATCGTALTEEHFRLLSRFAKRVILCFDADSAGQNAAARIYEWERRHEIELAVAGLPSGSDPGSLARDDPEVLRDAIAKAQPFLGFRVERALGANNLANPEGRSRAAEAAIGAIAEHPDSIVRDQYVMSLVDRTKIPVDQLRNLLEVRRQHPQVEEPQPPPRDDEPDDDHDSYDGVSDAPMERRTRTRQIPRELRAGRDALVLAINEPELVAGRFSEVLFTDPTQRNAFHALANANALHDAIQNADDDAGDLLSQLAVVAIDDGVDVDGTYLALVRTAMLQVLAEIEQANRIALQSGDRDQLATSDAMTRWIKEELELMRDAVIRPGIASPAVEAASRLVAWLSEQGAEEQ